MLRKVKLYGKLAKFIGHRVLEADVNSAAEAIRFLLANWPELESHMRDQYYKISAEEWEMTEEELHYPVGGSDISIVPVVGGAGRGSGKILLGMAIIGAAILFPGSIAFTGGGFGVAAAGTAAGTAAWAAGSAILANVGMYLILTGVAQSLTPVPDTPDSMQDPKNSFSFSGTGNVSRAGVPVPICYGKVFVGSIVVSAAIDTNQVAV
tara:strand:- start:89 stop:712 length:624 start_codon:yes stop_codon:yes gene_type:complete